VEEGDEGDEMEIMMMNTKDMNEQQLKWWKEASTEITARRRLARQEATGGGSVTPGGGGSVTPGGAGDVTPGGAAMMVTAGQPRFDAGGERRW
jgi:hypothetical protein